MEWISVNDRLPEDNQRILIARKNGCVELTSFECVIRQMRDGENAENFWRKITHWMPLPEAPKQ